ncbi:MAG: hypothetical protein JWM02_2166 [Frankiales bacterium]|nr:hypothetical protein [Frankiales bacterium]
MGFYITNNFNGCEDATTSIWVSAITAQNWNLIPIALAQQAPSSCGGIGGTSSSTAISLTGSTAFSQGQVAGSAARTAAINRGITVAGDGITPMLALDIEGYTNATSSCDNAVAAFVSGYVYYLKGQGWHPYVYGSVCGSYPTDWVTISSNVPEGVYLAEYNHIHSVYSVNSSCLNPGYWSVHQRLHQYDHQRTLAYGGVGAPDSNGYDVDCVDGRITGRNFPNPNDTTCYQ